MHFGEYELFPSLIGLSPLPTVHPRAFQRSLVRPSMLCYQHFSLTMGRSQGFASSATDYLRPIQTRFRFGYAPKGLSLASDD